MGLVSSIGAQSRSIPGRDASLMRSPESWCEDSSTPMGCRFAAKRRVCGRIYEYPRCCFSNLSVDIHKIFREHLGLLGVRCTRATPVVVQIARRPSVIALDSFIGPKR
jgi:hypothetical protein